MRLHILRHAQAAFPVGSMKDFDRQLTAHGEEQALEVGKFMNEKLSRKIKIYCSSSERTRQTATIVQSQFEFRDIDFKDELYHADYKQLLDFIWSQEGHADFLLIGHNEGISDLIGYFSGKFTSLDTCEYACLEFDVEDWRSTSRDLGKLVDRFRPQV